MSDYGVYDGMEKIHNETGGRVVVDSAFKIGNRDFVLKSSQQDPMDPERLIINRAATSVRQLSEWGMRMIGGSFPRLKDALHYEEENERRVILKLMVHLHNFQAHNVGINQIMNSFCDKTMFYGHINITNDANNFLQE
jgi:hypothetical protein